jgi:23S rRNA G2069 N7-methylase RlmK/C1962 C5-methylase RlmI
MIENRLKKNLARLAPWAKRERVGAWRLYDRDIPEFPYFVDVYGDRALVSEFVTPVGRRQDAAARASEHEEVVDATSRVTGLERGMITLKTRERHLSLEREAKGDAAHEFAVEEHGHRFLVNLVDYLDTGLFLDHRVARKRVGAASAGKRVLNLFCYTGAFSVYAAKGGASSTTSVDLSATYLSWASRNLALNGVSGKEHALVRDDVFEFLRHAKESYDLIVLDPPTLSRAARGKSFDLARVWPELVTLAMARLAPGGLLLFSTNYRQFQLDPKRVPGCEVRDVTRETTPFDFKTGLHQAFDIRRAR